MKRWRNANRLAHTTSTLACGAVLLIGCGSDDPMGSGSGGASAGDGNGVGEDAGETGGGGGGDDVGNEDGSGGGDGPDSGVDGTGDSGNSGGNDSGLPMGDGCTEDTVPKTSQLPRLTRAQYDLTIKDLLLLDTQPSSMLAPDTVGSVDKRAWDGYQTAAKELSAAAMADPAARAQVVSCEPSGDGAECAAQIITEFGARAFRRPLTEEEEARFQSLYDTRSEITANGTFDEAIELIIRAFLVSPSFLTRAEIAEDPEGTHFVLNDYEVASRLSYMLWGSMPDETLFAAAAAGELSDSDQILGQAERMLADPRARARVADFHQHYMHMGPGTRWAEVSRSAMRYPLFDNSLVPTLSAETERFFDHIAFEDVGGFEDLILSPVAYVNAATAPLYGLDPANYGPQLEAVTLDDPDRAGLLTRVGFLASHAHFDRTAPILRGAFIQEEILCNDIPPPPPDVEGTPLPEVSEDGEPLITNRQRVDAQTAAGDCMGCHHALINPTGFTLESFDALGALQTTDNGEPLNTQADVYIGGEVVDVAGPQELMAAIASSPAAKACYAEKWVKYAYERELQTADECTAQELTARLSDADYSILNLVQDLTQSNSFRLRAQED